MPAAKMNAKRSLKLLQKTMKVADVNKFAVLEAIDGKPQSVKEFNETERDENDYFFRVSEDSTQLGNNCSFVVCNPQSRKADMERGREGKDRVLILNCIHKRLADVNDRFVPFLNDKRIEMYHREIFEGVDVDICVYWPGYGVVRMFLLPSYKDLLSICR
jgi:hypothetical protein